MNQKIQLTKIFRLSLILPAMLYSCKEPYSHNAAIKYYSTVTSLTHTAITKIDSLMEDEMKYASTVKGMFENPSSNQITETAIDDKIHSLKGKNQEVIGATDDIIGLLDKMGEIDADIGLKSKAITYIEHAKHFQTETFRYVLLNLRGNSSTDKQRNDALLPLKQSRDNMKISGSEYIEAAHEYIEKHKIPRKQQ